MSDAFKRACGIVTACVVVGAVAMHCFADKTDTPAEKSAERAERGKKLLEGVKFSHPTAITNPYLPLSSLKQDILMGTEGGMKTRVERTIKPDVRKVFRIGDQSIESLAMEEREFENGHLKEVTLDYFAQDDNGTVYYLGEDVDEYKRKKIVGHSGSWMLGKDTQAPGVMLPGTPKVGDQFRPEDVSDEIGEIDEIVSLSETVNCPAGKFENCIKVKETFADGGTEYKYYARGVGVVREVPDDGELLLKSHEAQSGK